MSFLLADLVNGAYATNEVETSLKVKPLLVKLCEFSEDEQGMILNTMLQEKTSLDSIQKYADLIYKHFCLILNS